MPKTPCPIGRREAAALASMNVRTRVTPFGVEYLARPVEPLRLVPTLEAVAPRFQPRNEIGRYVSYASMRSAIAFEYEVTRSEVEEVR